MKLLKKINAKEKLVPLTRETVTLGEQCMLKDNGKQKFKTNLLNQVITYVKYFLQISKKAICGC